MSKGSASEVQVEYEEVVLPVLRSPWTKVPAFSRRPPEAFLYYEGPPSPSPPPRTPSVHFSVQSAQEGRTGRQVREGYLQLFAVFWSMILLGWNDGTTGPLLPRIQTVYDVNYTIVSLLFVSACTGFVAGAIINVPLSTRLGFGKVCSALQVIAYAVDATAPPFPVLCVAYAVNGAGMSLQDAQTNGYVASLTENQEAKMGMLHAAYGPCGAQPSPGLGAFAAPLVSTQFAQMHRWSFHYLTSMGVALANMAISAAVFRFENQDRTYDNNNLTARSGNSLIQLFRLKSMHLLALFAFVYVGVEVTLGGWIVSYVIDKRGGGPDSGYISSGFFAGMMLGRLVLLWVNKKIGEWPVIFVYGLLAIGLELVVWLVPSLLGGAISVALVGLLLGPFFPIAMNQAARILPGFLLTPSIGWIAGIGQAGSAVLPFVTGALAQGTGIGSLQPFLVSMMAFMMILWAMVPRKAQRMD
ncbi:MFS general substrate transporter [Schizophyllum commune H4-8]|nr:MFS general substrate transporter [Schizophyllum commune H4-8]KAI5897112.1 MFS general substrate transporter [Schizophyllum commune H4-8]